MTRDELVALPKVELHCHLDGSLSRNFIEKRLGRKVSQEELSVSDDCRSLNEYLEKFDLPGQCLMDEEGLREQDMMCFAVCIRKMCVMRKYVLHHCCPTPQTWIAGR